MPHIWYVFIEYHIFSFFLDCPMEARTEEDNDGKLKI